MTRWLFKAIAATQQRSAKDWAGKKDQSSQIQTIIYLVDENYKEIAPKLTGIHTDSKDDNTKKCKFSAALVFTNGNTLDKGYAAQLTEDGNLYVESHSMEKYGVVHKQSG